MRTHWILPAWTLWCPRPLGRHGGLCAAAVLEAASCAAKDCAALGEGGAEEHSLLYFHTDRSGIYIDMDVSSVSESHQHGK